MTAIATHLERRLARAAATTARWKQARQTPQPVAQLVHAADWLTRAVFFVWRNRRYLTTLKLGNMALVNLQYLLKTERVIGRPYNMKIESTNICNTHCQLCPTGLGLRGRPKGQMTLDQYKQLIDRFRWHLFGLDLSMWGDPLIVPHIYDMIRYAHDRGIWTYLSSNLHAFKLNPKPGQTPQAQKLVESGLDMLTCSLHGASQSTYETYQPGKRFHDALEKIRQIIQTRDRLGSATPVVQLNFVVTRHNEHEREAFQKLADDLGCRAVFSTAMMNVRFLDKDQQLQPLGLAEDVLAQKVRDHLANWLPRDSRYVLEPYKKIARTGRIKGDEYNGRKLFDCSWPWRASVINWDGRVATCCGSFTPAEDLGSVFEQPFGKIWNGPKYRLARRSFKKRLSPDQAKDNPCATCPGFML